MKRHIRSFFGQKTGIIFDSDDQSSEYAYMTFIRKQQNGIWEKPSERQGKKIKLNLGELIMIRRLLAGLDDKWSTIHTFKEVKTQISISRNNKNREQIWINVDSYSKNIKLPETEIFQLLLNHIIDEKIVYSTCNKPNKSNSQKAPNNDRKIEEHPVKNEQTGELPEKKVSDNIKNNNQNGDFTEIEVLFVRETEKAVCIQFKGEEKESWVPKSILKNLPFNSDEYQNLLLPNWFNAKR
jgi:hypothetical protein